ncbi:MAG: hypothetical protein ABIQ16_21590 [Polyangiaceae bacterium]
MTSSTRVSVLVASLALGSALVSSACSSGDAAGGARDAESPGEVGLELNVGGVVVTGAAYVITGPSAYSKSGNLEVGNSNGLSGVIGGIPVAQGYAITISATSVDGTTTCSGSASFNVTAHRTTPVTVNLSCHQAPRTGSVAINGAINVCPTIDGISANPSEVTVGHSLALSVTAHDADAAPGALVYRWSATSGSFNDVGSPSPTFSCTAPGTFAVTVSASDGDPSASCADSSTVQITCSIPGSGSGSVSTIAMYGDAPYGTTPTDTSETLATPAFIAAVNADPEVSLVMHVGDIHSGKQYCTEAYNRTVFDLWTAFQDPLVYTPGDNEWSDCHKVAEGGGLYNAATQQIEYVLANGVPVDYASGDPLANLALVRSIFFAQPGQTLGGKKAVLSQAQFFDSAHPTDAKFVENVMFEQSRVLFVSINLPGGSNNDNDIWFGAPTQTPEQAQEVVERTGADLRWLDAAFAQAQADGVVAVLIQAQADMWDPEKGAAHQAAYEPFVQKIATQTTAFGKPVILFNGDSHVYQSGNPLSPSDPAYAMHPGYDVPNFHRVVVHGSTFPLEWLKVRVDPAVDAPHGSVAFGPFSWTQIISE